jgi:hypothetical protein
LVARRERQFDGSLRFACSAGSAAEAIPLLGVSGTAAASDDATAALTKLTTCEHRLSFLHERGLPFPVVVAEVAIVHHLLTQCEIALVRILPDFE